MISNSIPLRVAIVGSGPAAFFCADYLLRLARPCTVALFERRPYPFGLVRDAVAPDKPNIRAAATAFARTAQCPGFSFWGNICVGKDISLDDLRKRYHAVIIAAGASRPRRLDIQGSGLSGCEDAVAFAGWYNGCLDDVDLCPDLSGSSAVIIGVGNAALDAARILASPASVLERTDISSAAMEVLRECRVSDIHIVARRGPYQVRFAPQELELLAKVPGCRVVLHASPEQLEPPDLNAATGRMRKAYDTTATAQGGERCVHLHFNMTPVAVMGAGNVTGVLFETQEEEYLHISCGMLINSTGQAGCPVAGLPFDAVSNRIPNLSGRVMEGETVIPGVYTAGAVKRGANSVIGANKPDCLETVQCILADRSELTRAGLQDDSDLPDLLKHRGVRVVTFQDWMLLDVLERGRGTLRGKPRDRYLSLEMMFEALDREKEKETGNAV